MKESILKEAYDKDLMDINTSLALDIAMNNFQEGISKLLLFTHEDDILRTVKEMRKGVIEEWLALKEGSVEEEYHSAILFGDR